MGQLADALMAPLQRRLTEAGTVGQRDVAAMLNLLGEAELRSSLTEGCEAVAKLADFPLEAVWLRLPVDALLDHATAVGHAQVEALGVEPGDVLADAVRQHREPVGQEMFEVQDVPVGHCGAAP